jgi:hypothetical protein
VRHVPCGDLDDLTGTIIHHGRGEVTPDFRPGRERRLTSPGMLVVLASVFACPGAGCFPHPPGKWYWNPPPQTGKDAT